MKRLFVLVIMVLVASSVWAGLNEDLFEAVKKGDKKKVAALIKKGADVNDKSKAPREHETYCVICKVFIYQLVTERPF